MTTSVLRLGGMLKDECDGFRNSPRDNEFPSLTNDGGARKRITSCLFVHGFVSLDLPKPCTANTLFDITVVVKVEDGRVGGVTGPRRQIPRRAIRCDCPVFCSETSSCPFGVNARHHGRGCSQPTEQVYRWTQSQRRARSDW